MESSVQNSFERISNNNKKEEKTHKYEFPV